MTDPVADAPSCPRCGGEMWDNRESKRNPRAPDFKCKNRTCDGAVWRKDGARNVQAPAAGTAVAGGPAADADGYPLCPICGGPMWDDRESKRNPRAPDFKCRNKPRGRGGPGCEGVIWPSRDGTPSPYPPPRPRRAASPSASSRPPVNDAPPHEAPPFDDDDIPF